MKAYLFIALITSTSLMANDPFVLNDPILKKVDGIRGLMDGPKIRGTLWLIKEIKLIHQGFIKINEQGIPDPSRGAIEKELIFHGKRQTIDNFIHLEQQELSHEERQTFKELFAEVKDYFDKVNHLLLADAQGTQSFMIQLIREFCKNTHRQESMLLNWSKGAEVELYQKTVTDFKKFHSFSSDLMHFLAVLIKSCPRAMQEYKDSIQHRMAHDAGA